MNTPDLLEQVDLLRKRATVELDQDRRAEMGQVMTPPSVARLMASMFQQEHDVVRLLDPGAGIGSLTAAAIAAFLSRPGRPTSIEIVAYEVDAGLVECLARTLELCGEACESVGVAFKTRIEFDDFLDAAAKQYLTGDLPHYNYAILNPPYRKIRSGSAERAICSAMGLEVTNLYAAFVGATIHLLDDEGEMVAITPRSFANGPYFRAFRGFLLSRAALQRVHVFRSRNRAFADDDVLQENVILHARKATAEPEMVAITSSDAPGEPGSERQLPWRRVVYEHDREQFIHLIETDEGDAVAEQMACFDNYLVDLGVSVSTGPVVDFRAPEFLREVPAENTVPLLYPGHLRNGVIEWPRKGRPRWNALELTDETYDLTVPNADYVLVKRFTAKEERRRLVAVVSKAAQFPATRLGLENHLNFYHANRGGLSLALARGLALYLNSTLVDTYFRQFSGHTQVNATDLRYIPYPPRDRLEAAGRAFSRDDLAQEHIDAVVQQYMLS